jgi:hypothetical protein
VKVGGSCFDGVLFTLSASSSVAVVTVETVVVVVVLLYWFTLWSEAALATD